MRAIGTAAVRRVGGAATTTAEQEAAAHRSGAACGVRGLTRARALPALALLVATVWLWGCRREESAAPVVTPTAWDAVGEAPAVAWVDLARLREDARLAQLWAGAGATEAHPLAAAMAGAAGIVVAWPEATFQERLNVLLGVSDAPGAAAAMASRDGLASYPAGAGTIYAAPSVPWAVAGARGGLMLTGTQEAVRGAMSRLSTVETPGASRRAPAGAVAWASVDVSDDHRRVARLVAPQLAGVLDSVAAARVSATLGVGLDVAATLVAPTDDAGVALEAVATLLVQMAAELVADAGGVVPALVARGAVRRGDARTVEVIWEFDGAEVDALVAAVAGARGAAAPRAGGAAADGSAGGGAEAPAAEGSAAGTGGAAATTAPTVTP